MSMRISWSNIGYAVLAWLPFLFLMWIVTGCTTPQGQSLFVDGSWYRGLCEEAGATWSNASPGACTASLPVSAD